mgnify:CR=1 FL=1
MPPLPAAEPPEMLDEDTVADLRAKLDSAARARLGRSLTIHHLDTGSCNGCELEINALNNPYYNLEGLWSRAQEVVRIQ